MFSLDSTLSMPFLAAFRAAMITGILGALLGVVYLIGGRGLAPCITAHFLITLALEPGLLIAAVTNEWRFETALPQHDQLSAG